MGTDTPTPAPAPMRLRNLPLPARLVISAFLISVGCGYFAALVQLNFKHASNGNMLPTRDDLIRDFHGPIGDKPRPKLQNVLEAEENKPFNGTGTMRLAFTTKSGGWEGTIKKRAAKMFALRRADPDEDQLKKAETELRKERDSERLALVEWIEKGADKDAYENDSFCISDKLAECPIDEKFVGDPPDNGGHAIKIKGILDTRCVKCHAVGTSSNAAKFPLENYDQLAKYLKVKESQAISEENLIQSTHVHLLSFSMLWGLTGLIFAFTSYPVIVRALIAPLPLVAQLLEIACWWLARLDPRFVDGITIAGGVIGAGVMLHIGLTLLSLYGKAGKGLVALLLVALALGGWQVKQRYIDPRLAQQTVSAPTPDK